MSSANFHKSEELPGIAKSLIIAKKSQGPILVPCGIPAGTISECYFIFFVFFLVVSR